MDYIGSMAVIRATLGFRLHTGWAAVVAATEQDGQIRILLRRRLELLPEDGSIPRFVYHTAAEMETFEAAALVKLAIKNSQETAYTVIKGVLEGLKGMSAAIKAAGICTGSTVVPDDLAKILKSHSLIHAAEGSLFQQAVAAACESCGLKMVAARERELWVRAADAGGVDPGRLRQSVDDLRQTVGPPWTADQKIATAAALLALRTSAAPRADSPKSSKR